MLRRSITFAVITLPLILYGTACQSSEPSPSTPSVLQPQIATFQALESTLKPRGSTPPPVRGLRTQHEQWRRMEVSIR